MRDIKQLHPNLQAILSRFTAACSDKGLGVGIGECLRTMAEQDELYAQGRTKPGGVVTNAKGSTYQSCHQWGIAFDFYRKDGRGAFDDSDGFFYKVGQVGKNLGLSWGGDWTSPKDKPHFQLSEFSPDGTANWLKGKYGTPEKFMAAWKKEPAVKSDTTSDITIKRGAFYTVKFTSSQPVTVTAGTGGVVVVVPIDRGADKLAAIVAIGKSGDSTGIYTQIPGGQAVKQFCVKIS